MHVFVTGATGLVGRAVCGALLERGHRATALSRSRDGASRLPSGVAVAVGDPVEPGPWQDELARADACVNLAGEPIAARWTAARKRRIRESRLRTTAHVAETVRRGGPRVLVSGSAYGFYGSRGDAVLDEASAPGEGFLADVAREWEEAARPAAERARLVLLRSGVVLAREGGALPLMALQFRLMAGGPLGDGAFWQSWIHLADEVGLVLLALEDPRVEGPLNAVAPEPALNRDLARTLGKVLRRPSLLPTPSFAMRLVLGELADEMRSSQRAVPRKALELGYRYRFPDLEGALRDLLGRRTEPPPKE